jgi:hypothetical protein
MYLVQDEITRSTMSLGLPDFPAPPYLRPTIGPGPKVDVIVEGHDDRQVFKIDCHELMDVHGIEAVAENIQFRSTETSQERVIKDSVREFLNLFRPIEEEGNNNTGFRGVCWDEMAHFIAEYTKRDPSVIDNLARIFDRSAKAALRIERERDKVLLCFQDFDSNTDYSRLCTRALEVRAEQILKICIEINGAGNQDFPIEVRDAALSAIIFMLRGCCASWRELLYEEIMTESPDSFWLPVLDALNVVNSQNNGHRRELGEIYAFMIPHLRPDLLVRFAALV